MQYKLFYKITKENKCSFIVYRLQHACCEFLYIYKCKHSQFNNNNLIIKNIGRYKILDCYSIC